MRRISYLLAAAYLLTVVAVALAFPLDGRGSTSKSPPRFSHVTLVLLENKPASALVGNPAAPGFNRLARRGALLTNYYAVAHPSLPNYLALVSGSTHGVRTNCMRCVISAPSIADTLGAAGLTWNAYVEGITRSSVGDIDVRAVKARIPFLYFHPVLDNTAQLHRIVPLEQFNADSRHGRRPTFSLVVPSLCHDMHNCSVSTGDRWLSGFVGGLLRRSGPHDVVFLLFDESSRADRSGGGGHVAALALGPLVRPGSTSGARLDHYSLLRTVEDGLGLPPLGRSAAATPITGIWR